MPQFLKLLLLFVVGGAIGRMVVWAAWALTYGQPTSPPPRRGKKKQQRDAAGSRLPRWVPFFGAWRKSTPAGTVGPAGLRPPFVELALGVGIAVLYWWEVEHQGLVRGLLPLGEAFSLDNRALHATFFSHVLLIAFMLAATLVDIDEQTIPDLITLPGTIAGLLLAALLPQSLLPALAGNPGGATIDFLTLSSPRPLPPQLAAGAPLGLAVALGCFAAWCMALLPWRLRLRHGLARAARLAAARIAVDPLSRVILFVALAGSVGVFVTWRVGGDPWRGLLSALVGTAAGGLVIWAVRIVASLALGREAMGFGDVTLMAMIGAYLGWQASPIIFFLAPLAGLVIGVVQWIIYRDNVIPYGPFLCLASLVVILRWASLWRWAEPLYDLWWLVPAAMTACLAMLALLLALLRGLRYVLHRAG